MCPVVIPAQAGIHLPSAEIVKDAVDAILLRFEKMIENEQSAALTPAPLPEGEGFVPSPLLVG